MERRNVNARSSLPSSGRERENVWRETTRVSREVDARERSSVLASRGFFSARCIRRARADILFSQFFFRPILLQQHTHPFGKDDGDGETDPQQFLSLLSRINNNSQVEEKTHPQIETQAQKDAHEIEEIFLFRESLENKNTRKKGFIIDRVLEGYITT